MLRSQGCGKEPAVVKQGLREIFEIHLTRQRRQTGWGETKPGGRRGASGGETRARDVVESL